MAAAAAGCGSCDKTKVVLPRGSKIPDFQENPLDVLLERLSRQVAVPVLRATGHTPNAITGYSFACGLVALACLAHGRVHAACVWLALGYFFDVVDGQYARTFGLVTHAGDVFDHMTDLVVAAGLGVLLVVRYGVAAGALVGGLALAGSVLSLGCQQRNVAAAATTPGERPQSPRRGGGESLDRLRRVCPDRRMVRVTRFLGGATSVLVVILGCLLLERRRGGGITAPHG